MFTLSTVKLYKDILSFMASSIPKVKEGSYSYTFGEYMAGCYINHDGMCVTIHKSGPYDELKQLIDFTTYNHVVGVALWCTFKKNLSSVVYAPNASEIKYFNNDPFKCTFSTENNRISKEEHFQYSTVSDLLDIDTIHEVLDISDELYQKTYEAHLTASTYIRLAEYKESIDLDAMQNALYGLVVEMRFKNK